MWRFKPFMPKEQAGLEGRTIDVGNLKLHVRNAIAEGGFSCVYLVRDVIHPTKQYALKHIICNDEESLELVMKEITVMKVLKGHPNIVTLCAHTFVDMGRTKEALLVMEYCEKSLVNVLESRGAGYFDEKQVLQLFRDICNAVFAMHCQSPPIAHRDLKAENLLLGSDGLWKLCDFGSTSTNHKRFEKPEEMGIEEDNIRKHTTPAYRSPEMWDLFRRELINEKVDIWALGCLLFRICYFKSAFDGESKLQVLNGNYRIPELPRYNSIITDLIRDMLQSLPDDRPDIMQVWFRVNEQLPANLQKSLPDRPPEMSHKASDIPEGISKPVHKSSPMPRRSPPPPPSSKESTHNLAPPAVTSKAGGDGGPLGAFWVTHHAKNSATSDNKGAAKFDDEPATLATSKPDSNHTENNPNSAPLKDGSAQFHLHGKSPARFEDGPSKGSEMSFFQEVSIKAAEKPKVQKVENVDAFQNDTFDTFVAEFDASKLTSGLGSNKTGNEQALQAEVERLNELLQQASVEKAEITSKYEKLSAICRSQRQEIQELKQALAVRTPSPNRDALRKQGSPGIGGSGSTVQREKAEGTAWKLQQEISDENSQSPDSKPWQAFTENPKPAQTMPKNNDTKSVRTRNSPQNTQTTEFTSSTGLWGFGSESFTAVPAAGSQKSGSIGGKTSSHFDDFKKMESNPPSQPAGWAGF